MIFEKLEEVRASKPLIHCLTNYVTVNDVANMILASGASPVMADEEEDALEIADFSSASYINIGTLNQRTMATMKEVAKKSAKMNKPVILDPVGAGATEVRTKFARKLLEKGYVNVVRGNLSEIKVLVSNKGGAIGVDASELDFIREENILEVAKFLKEFALKFKVVVAATGEIDLITDGNRTFAVYNGCAEMSRITGTGCQLTALIAAFVAAHEITWENRENLVEAVTAAVVLMGMAGEIGVEHLQAFEGNATLRNRIIDAIYAMNENWIQEKENWKEI